MTSAGEAFWWELMGVASGTPVGDLPWPVEVVDPEPVPNLEKLFRVTGTDAYLNTVGVEARRGEVCGLFWASCPEAFLRVLAFPVNRVFHAPLPEQRVHPPGLLLPPGADDIGSHDSILDAIRALDLYNGETAGYRIMTDGAFIYQEIATGRAGVKYTYLELEDPDAPVEVIGLSPARRDWAPDLDLRARITGPAPALSRRGPRSARRPGTSSSLPLQG